MTAGTPTGRVAATAVVAAAGLGLGLLWLAGRRPAAAPIVRCPIHGIAYDTELEVCPDCARTSEALKGRES
jgi:hypothetical protein